MIPIFAKLLVISMAANKGFGCSSKCTIRLKEGCFLDFNKLMSLDVNEKNATSLPATKKERINKMHAAIIRMPVAAVVRAKNTRKLVPGTMTE